MLLYALFYVVSLGYLFPYFSKYQAVLQISKASKHEACTLPSQAEVFYKDIKSNLLAIEKKIGKDTCYSRSSIEIDTKMDITDSGKFLPSFMTFS